MPPNQQYLLTTQPRIPEYVAAQREISKAWLSTAKIARKSKHFQTAYSAVLQAREIGDPFAFIESCKLIKADGENFRALLELENSIARMPRLDTEYEVENTRLTGKVMSRLSYAPLEGLNKFVGPFIPCPLEGGSRAI